MGKLAKELKFIDIFSIAAGAMVSSGIFLLPGVAYGRCGASVVMAYFLAGLMSIPGVLSISELVTAMPKAGGGYFFVTRSLGAGVGTVAGILSWFSLIFKTTFALVGLSTYAVLFLSIDPRIIGTAICVIFLIINYRGVTKAGSIQVFLVFTLFTILTIFVFYSMEYVDITNFTTVFKGDLGSIMSTAGFVFVSYGGLLKVASLAEEAEDAKHLPKGMILALIIISIFYTLLVFLTVGILKGNVLVHSMTPISDAGFAVLGKKGRILLSIAALIGFVSASNVGIMSASRYPYALSKDKMFPEIFEKVSSKYKTPVMSIAITGLLIISGLFLNLNILVEVASTSLILTYILANLSVIIMRESRLTNYKPHYKAPLYPYLQIIGIFIYIFLIFELGKDAILATLVFVIISLIVYLFYGRKRRKQEYALLHVIERVLNKEFAGVKLEKELRNILQERDAIKEDRFDKLVKKALVFDFEDSMTFEELYKEVSEKLGNRLNIPAGKIYDLLCEKEKRYTSVLGENIAIPHIIIDGENIFDVVIIRNRKGVIFQDNKKINVVFILIGSMDERNFHLKALSAIAQVVNGKDFYKRWMDAKTSNVLKDIVLLSNRQR
ncbi:amino acid permease [Deferribacteraceae bacterium V6Fe1]|nr:amino acid permease [Deferribacteraceae bacterium V6Fe1]